MDGEKWAGLRGSPRLTGPLAVLVAAGIVACSDSGPAGESPQPCTLATAELELDFGTGEPDPVVVGPVLETGRDYLITVSGTYSIWTNEWSNGPCKGTPAGGVGGLTGIDPEYFFAIPVGSALCAASYDCCPNHTSKFKISVDGGSDFDHTHPVVEPYNPAHTYQYRVTGQGLPVQIMLEENSARGDDYGILQIRVACAG